MISPVVYIVCGKLGITETSGISDVLRLLRTSTRSPAFIVYLKLISSCFLVAFVAFAFVPETIRHLTDNHEHWKKAAEDWVRVISKFLAKYNDFPAF